MAGEGGGKHSRKEKKVVGSDARRQQMARGRPYLD